VNVTSGAVGGLLALVELSLKALPILRRHLSVEVLSAVRELLPA
jgi:hypothetical protein